MQHDAARPDAALPGEKPPPTLRYRGPPVTQDASEQVSYPGESPHESGKAESHHRQAKHIKMPNLVHTMATLLECMAVSLHYIFAIALSIIFLPWKYLKNWLQRRFGSIWLPDDMQEKYPIMITPLLNLWQSSRLQAKSDGTLEPLDDDTWARDRTLRNTLISARIYWMVGVRSFALMCRGQELQVACSFLLGISQGVMDSLPIWAGDRLLEEAQKTFAGGAVNLPVLVTYALLAAFSELAIDVVAQLSKRNDHLIGARVSRTMREKLMSVEASLDPIVTADEPTRIVRREAKGLAPRSSGATEVPRLSLQGDMVSLLQIARATSVLAGRLFLLIEAYRRLWEVVSPLQAVSLVVVPMVAHSAYTIFGQRSAAVQDAPHHQGELQYLQDLPKLFKEEFALNGLVGWVTNEWQRLSGAEDQESRDGRPPYYTFAEGFFKTFAELSDSSVYIIAAMSGHATLIPLSALVKCRGGGREIFKRLKEIRSSVRCLINSSFRLAAFWALEEVNSTGAWMRPNGWYWEGREAIERPVSFDDTRTAGKGVVLEAKNLGFTYPGASKPALHDINVEIKAGETLAIVGFNGGGKSTLASVLVGLLDYTEGDLYINGHSSKSITLSSYRNRVATLLQNFGKIGFSMRKNVGFGDTDKLNDKAALKAAIKKGGAGEMLKRAGFHKRMPHRWETFSDSEGSDSDLEDEDIKPEPKPDGTEIELAKIKVEEETNDKTYSGSGLWSWVRAWCMTFMASVHESVFATNLHRPKPRINTRVRRDRGKLDFSGEPSSALDPRAEHELFQTIKALSDQNKTTIYISHRFSVVHQADKIAVVEDGTIVEFGPHKELMAKEGRYHELFNLQKAGYDEPENR
ncbi:hypothetical protein P7C73_g1773, partial [Tremellales sp. Uapishka_1]